MDSLKVDTKTQPGERDSEMVTIYVQLFRTGITDPPLNLFTILNKIIWGHDLFTGPHDFGRTRNLVVGEAIRVFEQKNRDRGTETNMNYELVIKELTTHFFPRKEIHIQKRYLRRGLYKPRDTKIRDFIFRTDKTV